MNVLIKPVITEKATKSSESDNKYVFVVNKSANKIQIKEAVHDKYGVSVEAVNTMNYAPKKKAKYTKKGLQYGKTPSLKKAIIQIAEGESIDFYSNL